MIEAVVFDYGGVIGSGLFHRLGEFEAMMGYPPGSIVSLLFGDDESPNGDAVSHDYHRLEIGAISLDEYLAGIEERAPRILGGPVDLDAYYRYAGSMPIGVHWTVVQRVRDLRDAGLRLGLLTNNVREFGDTWRSTFPVDELFEVVIDSSEVGMRKPDRRIYLLTCERLGVDPGATVFVDDNRDNLRAARELGMEIVHFAEPIEALAALDEVLARRGVRPAR